MPRSNTKADAQPPAATARPRRERTAAQKAAAGRNLRHGRPAAISPGAGETAPWLHAVQPGETLESIAAAFGTSAEVLFAANRDIIGSAPRVEVGMPLQVQVAAAAAAALEDGAASTQEVTP